MYRYVALIALVLACSPKVLAAAADPVQLKSKAAVPPSGASSVFVEVTNVLKQALPGYISLISIDKPSSSPVRLELDRGKALRPMPPGTYKAYIYVYDWDVPVLCDIQDVAVTQGDTALISFELTQGVDVPLRNFDQDFDLVLDELELKVKTDPASPVSFPNAEPLPFDSPILDKSPNWYKGDLHVRSIHGGGAESVADLIKRAEKTGLDFIAITDRNTMEACYQADFKSDKVVLIPAMEWGDEKRGVALIYGPSTKPAPPSNFKEDQAVCQLVQAQGGIFAVAHPCFQTAPWQRGLRYVNAIEVWCREYRKVPGVTLDKLSDDYRKRDEKGNLVYSMSLAASTLELSANGQANMFWDYETTRGLKAACIAGSLSSSPKVPMGQPLTYIYAREKSVRGLLEGLRFGRTVVAAGPDAPFIDFVADAQTKPRTLNVDLTASEAPKQTATVGRPDVSVGGIVPLSLLVDFTVQVKNAKGMKLEVLRNGWSILSKKVEGDKTEMFRISDTPTSYSVYRARLSKTPTEKGIGPLEMVSMTAPIYAQDIVPIDPAKKDPWGNPDTWIKIKNDGMAPAKVSERVEEGGKTRIRLENGASPQPVAPSEALPVPPNANVKEIKPRSLN